LYLAIKNGHLEIAKMLIKKTEPQYLIIYDGDTAFYLAIEDEHLEIAEMLIKKTEPQYLTLRNYPGQIALHLAIKNGHLEIAKMPVQKTDPQYLTVQNNYHRTLLDNASLRIKLQLLCKNPTLLRIMIGQKTICFSLLTLIVILLCKLM
jgi:ankyrin repeat protein